MRALMFQPAFLGRVAFSRSVLAFAALLACGVAVSGSSAAPALSPPPWAAAFGPDTAVTSDGLAALKRADIGTIVLSANPQRGRAALLRKAGFRVVLPRRVSSADPAA